jgi:hypothetical protein
MSAYPGPLKRDLGKASQSVQSSFKSIRQTSGIDKGMFAASIGGACAMAIGKMIKNASNLEESIGKIGSIFGSQGKDVENDDRMMADTFGVSLNAMLDSSGKLGGLVKGGGFDGNATAVSSSSSTI